MTSKDSKVIIERIDDLFKRQSHTQYWIEVFDDKFDGTYNFFFYIKKKYGRQRSIPLHTVKEHDLEHFETIIKDIKDHTQLTINYLGFAGKRWQSNGKLIQKMPSKEEDIF